VPIDTAPPRPPLPAPSGSLTWRMREIVPDVHTWSVFAPDKGYAFNGYAVSTEEGTVLIDPPEPGEDGWDAVDLLEPFAGVWITNRNHSRAAAAFRERYGLSVWAHEADAERLESGADRTILGDERLPGDIEPIHVPGKSPGEIAFHLPRSRALVVGDAVIGVPPGELSTYPDEVIDDREELQRSAARLLEYDFDALLLCDGEPLPSGGKEKLREFVEAASA
jgi:glyoxylase-like metal-dependent hydrolase (beta-lactamase superfamily II)